ncbi:hypothetical protein GCM10008986_34940 [Salinibacillus aidingensis]|uniref:Phospholipase A(2) n=1 Tax=Salinibacillus aidingensis TaxID=237684 RepID=A0ABP3LQQ3_9BACI
MDKSKSRFMTLQQAKNIAGDLKQSDLVKDRIGESSSVSPTVAVTELVVDGELYFKLVTAYYYVNEELQLLVAEAKDHNNNTVEFTEKIWEYDRKSDLYNHKKYVNNELTVRDLLEGGYGKPNEIAEFEDAKRFEGNIEPLDNDTAAGACVFEDPPFGVEPCCLFGGVQYNYCGKYCGVGHDAGGGGAVNACDVCCYFHDTCLIENSDPCPCHANLLDCYGRNSCPGDTTMGLGIRVQATLDGCYF